MRWQRFAVFRTPKNRSSTPASAGKQYRYSILVGVEMSGAQTANSQKILVIDVGGTHIKLLATGQKVPRKMPSGPTMTARRMVKLVKQAVRDWAFDRVSMGYP